MTVLVTGARGQVGSLVVQGLVSAGVGVRATSRSIDAADVPPGVEAVRADLTQPDSLVGGLDGVRQVFLYAQDADATRLVDVLADAGVEHVVLLSSASVLFGDAESNPIARMHVAAERALEGSGLAWTFVRPAYFATNALRWTSIRTERVLRTAFPEATTPMVHEQDIADLAVAALRDDRLRQQGLAALGATPLTVREQVGQIATALGTPVRVEQVSEQAYREELVQSLPAAIVDRLIRGGGSAPLPPPSAARDAVETVLGRPPLTFARWARDHVDDFR